MRASLAAALGASAFIAGTLIFGCSSSSTDSPVAPGDAAVSDGGLNVQRNIDGAADDAAPAIRSDRFVVDAALEVGACGGYGASGLPVVVQGPPLGGGDTEGSLDVVSLGTKGSIVLTFGANAIVDGPGIDFIVFENVF